MAEKIEHEGHIPIQVTPTVRERLKKYKVEVNARNYAEAITALFERLDGKDKAE